MKVYIPNFDRWSLRAGDVLARYFRDGHYPYVKIKEIKILVKSYAIYSPYLTNFRQLAQVIEISIGHEIPIYYKHFSSGIPVWEITNERNVCYKFLDNCFILQPIMVKLFDNLLIHHPIKVKCLIFG